MGYGLWAAGYSGCLGDGGGGVTVAEVCECAAKVQQSEDVPQGRHQRQHTAGVSAGRAEEQGPRLG